MKIAEQKSLDEITEKDMLKFIYANQIQIMRQISNIQSHLNLKDLKEVEISNCSDDVNMFVNKTDYFLNNVNNYLSKRNC